MSADNWTKCPKCGEAPAENEYHPTPLREDYEIGIYDGEFFISYGGRCMVCGFEKKFNHTEKVL